MKLEQTQRIILETIVARNGEWNWYKLSRYCMNTIESPDDIKLKPLIDAGLVTEQLVNGEPLPRLFVTELGRQYLQPLK